MSGQRRKRSRVYTISIPYVLDEQMLDKLSVVGYTGVPELCRELIRKWVSEG